MNQQSRVLIIGAGATGCNVAHYLCSGGGYEVQIWEQSVKLGAGGSLRSVQTASGITAELGAQVLSFEMQNKIVEQRCAQLQPWLTLLKDPGVYLETTTSSILAHTEERPSPWWEHYAVIGGTASLLSQILASSGAEVHLGRSALSVERGERLQVAHDSGTEEFDAVVVACTCDVGGFHVTAPGKTRHASLIQLDGPSAQKLRAIWEQGCREMSFDNGCGLITVWTWQDPIVATVHHIDAVAGMKIWLGVGEGIEVLEKHSFVQHDIAKPVGCVVATEDPLIVYCGDWCGGLGSFSSCIISAKAAADCVRAATQKKTG